MATFTINVSTDVTVNNKPTIQSSSDDECITEISILVKVPSGESRYINVNYLNANGTSYVNTINNDTLITLLLDGSISTQASNNDQFSSATLTVSLTSSSAIYYSKQITRQHTGNNC